MLSSTGAGVKQRWPVRAKPDNAKVLSAGYGVVLESMQFASLEQYKSEVVRLIGSDKFKPSQAGFVHGAVGEAGYHEFGFRDLLASIVWDEIEPQYIKAISQFLILCVSQYLSVDSNSDTASQADLQDALNIAKDQINVPKPNPANGALDINVVFGNLAILRNVLVVAVQSRMHSLRVTHDFKNMTATYVLDDGEGSRTVTLAVGCILTVGDALIFNANIAAAILQAVVGPSASDKLLRDLPHTLSVYGRMRKDLYHTNLIAIGGTYTTGFAPSDVAEHAIALRDAIRKVVKVIPKTFELDVSGLHGTLIINERGALERVKGLSIIHHILVFLHSTWMVAEKKTGWSAYPLTVDVILKDNKRIVDNKNLHLELLRDAYRVMHRKIPVHDPVTVKELTASLNAKFGTSVFAADLIEDVVSEAMSIFFVVMGSDPLLQLRVSSQGTPMSDSHKSDYQWSANNLRDINRVVFCVDPGLGRRDSKAVFREGVCVASDPLVI